MNIGILTIILLIQRALSVKILTAPLITVTLFNLKNKSLSKYSLVAGIIIDIMIGNTWGTSSIFLLLSSIEITLYKKQIESQNIFSIFLWGLVISLQANIFWGIKNPLSKYALEGIITALLFIITKNIITGKKDGVYLRG